MYTILEIHKMAKRCQEDNLNFSTFWWILFYYEILFSCDIYYAAICTSTCIFLSLLPHHITFLIVCSKLTSETPHNWILTINYSKSKMHCLVFWYYSVLLESLYFIHCYVFLLLFSSFYMHNNNQQFFVTFCNI